MDIQESASIHLEGSGFDLLPELKQLYLANGGSLHKALSGTCDQCINSVVFINCTKNKCIAEVCERRLYTAYVALVHLFDTQAELDLLKAGFHGVLCKHTPLVLQLQAIDCLMKGELYFSRKALSVYVSQMADQSRAPRAARLSLDVTQKERQVVNCVFKGMSNQQIADELNVSLHTVKMHLQNIYRKNRLRGRIELMSSY